jgi:hypothetical protein
MSATKKIVLASIVYGILFVLLGYLLGSYNCTKKKYKMNLKCVEGKLYEEIRPNMFADSHLECFER